MGGHRGRTLRADPDGGSRGDSTNQSLSGGSSGHLIKHPRQFSTRSKAKSSGNFKNLLRNTVSFDNPDIYYAHHQDTANRFVNVKRSKSSDILARRRTVSGLNMTALMRSRAHHYNEVTSPPHLRHSSLLGNSSFSLKPRRSKSTHSIMYLDDRTNSSGLDNSTTEEEVECFSEEEAKVKSQEFDNNNIQQDLSKNRAALATNVKQLKYQAPSNLIKDKVQRGKHHIDRHPHGLFEDVQVLKKVSNNSLVDLDDALNNPLTMETKYQKQEPLLNNLNLTTDRSLNNEHFNNNATIHKFQVEEDHVELGEGNKLAPEKFDSNDTEDRLKKIHSTTSNNGENFITHDANDDHIRHPNNNMYAGQSDDDKIGTTHDDDLGHNKEQHETDDDHIESDRIGDIQNTKIEGHSLTRQSTSTIKKNKEKVDHIRQAEILNDRERNNGTKISNIIKKTDNDINTKNEGYDLDFVSANSTRQYIPNMILSQSTGVERNFENLKIIDSNGKFPINDNSVQSTTSENQSPNTKNIDDSNNDGNKVNSYNNDAGVMTSKTSEDPNNNTNKSKEKVIKSALSSNLDSQKDKQITHIETSAKKSFGTHKTEKKIHFNLFNNESTSHNDDSINNFSNFLKDDLETDGDSRIQRKLWLQRESSIMDLSSQNNENNTVFMANDFESKREFERISHEYSNIRRFENPLMDSLLRLSLRNNSQNDKNEKEAKPQGFTSNLFSRYNTPHKNVEKFFDESEQAQLKRLLSSIWKEEVASFSHRTNPLSNGNSSTTNMAQHFRSSSKNSLKGVPINHGHYNANRTANSMQPSTRAVNKRISNALNQQNR